MIFVDLLTIAVLMLINDHENFHHHLLLLVPIVLVLYLNDLVVDVELMSEINGTTLRDLSFLLDILLIFVIVIHVPVFQDQYYRKMVTLHFCLVFHLKEYFHVISTKEKNNIEMHAFAIF